MSYALKSADLNQAGTDRSSSVNEFSTSTFILIIPSKLHKNCAITLDKKKPAGNIPEDLKWRTCTNY